MALTRSSACGVSRSLRPSEASQKPPSPSGAMPSMSSFCAGWPERVIATAPRIRAGVCVASISIDARLHAVDAVGDGEEVAGLARVGGEAGERAPAEERVGAGGGDGRVGRGVAVGELVEHHVGAGEAVLDEVDLVGGDEEVARRDRHGALRGDAGGEELDELGVAVAEAVDADDRGALGEDEEVVVVAEAGEFQALGLDALGVGAALGVVADLGDRVLEGGAAVEGDAAVAVEDGEAAAAALPVALVGGGEAVGADPLHGVGLARDAGGGLGEDQRAVVGEVDALEVGGAGGEVREERAVAAEDGDVVVLLQGHHDLAVGVDVDELGLGVVRRRRRRGR